MKIKNFDKKSSILAKKINSSKQIANIGIVMVILLEVICSLYIIFYILFNKKDKNIYRILALISVALFLIFMIVVTFIYHPPTDKLIPFMSNLTTFAGFLFILYIIL
tara:strand:+ start:740 stop:1060 length:321 start_codon:yes stop_codon:yes gene_type:complete